MGGLTLHDMCIRVMYVMWCVLMCEMLDSCLYDNMICFLCGILEFCQILDFNFQMNFGFLLVLKKCRRIMVPQNHNIKTFN